MGQRRRNLLIFWLFLVITSTSSWSFAKGREIPKLVKTKDNNLNPVSTKMKKVKDDNVVILKRVLIGSRPPRCERRCNSCNGACLAVQVPIVPSKLRKDEHQSRIFTSHNHHQFNSNPSPNLAYYSRGDDISNYKPMCWKCKCGNFIFNP